MKATLARLVEISRLGKIAILLMVDALLVALAFYLSFVFGNAKDSSSNILDIFLHHLLLFLLTLALSLTSFALGGLYRAVLRYGGQTVILAMIRSAGFLLLGALSVGWLYLYTDLPLRLWPLFWTYLITFTLGSRYIFVWLLRDLNKTKRKVRRVAVFGAGQAGVMLVQAMENSFTYDPVAFLDDDNRLHGRLILGRQVYPLYRLPSLMEDLGVTVVILAVPSLAPEDQRAILRRLQEYPVQIQTMPSLDDLAGGQVSVSQLRDVLPEELLLRPPVTPILELLQKDITGKVVLVTGGGGSIGSELSRQILKQAPKMLVVLDQSEFALYRVERALVEQLQILSSTMPAGQSLPSLKCVLGSVLDRSLLADVLRENGVQTIYHAAAYKHVPLLEINPLPAIRNNVFGTLMVAEAAASAGVSKFVMISTDKAVHPTNIMGATKRAAELIIRSLQKEHESITFAVVRFGNVLDSDGSVVPLFRRQIADGGPITLTDPEVSRYFMTIPEAAQLVIQAGAMGDTSKGVGGDIFLLDMGEPVKLYDLAVRLVTLSGLTVKNTENPFGDIEIVTIGLRAGEKLHEELLYTNAANPTRHTKIFKDDEPVPNWASLDPMLAAMWQAVENRDSQTASQSLMALVAASNT